MSVAWGGTLPVSGKVTTTGLAPPFCFAIVIILMITNLLENVCGQFSVFFKGKNLNETVYKNKGFITNM